MNYGEASRQVARLLTTSGSLSPSVVALTGPWGSGKTHLWRDVFENNQNCEHIQGALYASLFGIGEIEEVRQRLVQSAVRAGTPAIRDTVKAGLKTAAKLFELLPGGKAVADFQHLISPFLLQGRLLVLDDIERKSSALTTESVLGFVDEMTDRYDCRILLILNDVPLQDAAGAWDRLREKVIDHEVRLDPSPEDALMTVIGCRVEAAPPYWLAYTQQAVAECEIVNIRILTKIVLATQHLLEDHGDLPASAAQRVTAAITVLTALYYRGIKGAPSWPEMNFARKSQSGWDEILKNSGIEERPAEGGGWKHVLQRLGSYSATSLENEIVGYLNSGWLKSEVLKNEIDLLIENAEQNRTVEDMHEFFRKVYWDHLLSDDERLELARPIALKAHHLGAGALSLFLTELDEIPDSSDVVDSALKNWTKASHHFLIGETHDHFGRPHHPKVASVIVKQTGEPTRLSILDACKQLKAKFWANEVFDVLRSATIEQYAELIRTSSPDDLPILFGGILGLTRIEFLDQPDIPNESAKFMDACRQVHAHAPTSRLARLIESQFLYFKLPLTAPSATSSA